MAQVNPQKWFATSKTMIVAACVFLAGLGALIAPYTDTLHKLLGDKWFGIVMTTVGVVVAIARFVNSNLSLTPSAAATVNAQASAPNSQ